MAPTSAENFPVASHYPARLLAVDFFYYFRDSFQLPALLANCFNYVRIDHIPFVFALAEKLEKLWASHLAFQGLVSPFAGQVNALDDYQSISSLTEKVYAKVRERCM